MEIYESIKFDRTLLSLGQYIMFNGQTYASTNGKRSAKRTESINRVLTNDTSLILNCFRFFASLKHLNY